MIEAASAAEQMLDRGDVAGALALLDRAGAAGDASAFFTLARWRLIGHPTPRDLPMARALLRRAVEIGHVDAALMEIALTANGSGGHADWPGALRLLEVAANKDEVAAKHLALIHAMNLDAQGHPLDLAAPERLSEAPEIVRHRALLTPEECLHIAEAAHDILEPAVVIDPATGRNMSHPIRTSWGAVIGPTRESLVIAAINRRLAAASGSHFSQGESISLLRYAPGQEYRPHLDAIPNAANQRIATALVYLNQGFSGGETDFPEVGVRVMPGAGDVVIFRNLTPVGRPDPLTRHAGMPVISGVKWLATRWIRERPFDPWNLD